MTVINSSNNDSVAVVCAFSTLTLLVGQQEGHPACKKTEWWGSGMVICLERGANLHTAQLMPLPLTVSCFSKIQIGFTFLVPAHPSSPCKRAIKWVCVCCCSDLVHFITHVGEDFQDAGLSFIVVLPPPLRRGCVM